MKCPFVFVHSPKYRMRCYHYHSGTEWLNFESKDEIRSWKSRYCDGDPAGCPYYTANVGRDTEFEDVWLAIVTVSGRDYWRRVPNVHDLERAINDAISRAISIDLDNASITLQIKVTTIHSNDSGFIALIDELQFSGERLEDWPHWYGVRKFETTRLVHNMENVAETANNKESTS